MAIGIFLDPKINDIVIKDGSLIMAIEGEKLAQDIKTRLRINKGEATLDNEYGLPYADIFKSKNIDLSEIETLIKDFITGTEGVERITQFFFDYSGGESRTIEITFSVKSIEGQSVGPIQVTI